MGDNQERDQLFNKLLLKKDNSAAPYSKPNPKWTSKTFGVFVCLDCSGIHRSLGVHITFVKSANMDKWTSEELDVFRCSGGNQKARVFFSQHGWSGAERGQIAQKYSSRAAAMYKQTLAREVAAKKTANMGPTSPQGPPPAKDFFEAAVADIAVDLPMKKSAMTASSSAPQLVSSTVNQQSRVTPTAAPAPAAAAAPSVPQAAAAVVRPAAKPAASRMTSGRSALGGRKPTAGKAGGLGAKKLTVKVDDRLFEQAPKELEKTAAAATTPVSPGAGAAAAQGGVSAAHVAPPTQGRFSYNVGFGDASGGGGGGRVSAVSPKASGAGGSAAAAAGGAAGGGGFRSMSAKNAPNLHNQAAAASRNNTAAVDVAQSRFGAAKSISSNAFSPDQNDIQSGGYHGNHRMEQFAHQGAISSSDYFGENDHELGDERLDITAGELMSKMSFQAKQDVQHIKAVASRGAKALGNFLNEFK